MAAAATKSGQLPPYRTYPSPAPSGYGALVSGGTFAGVDQGIDFTGGPFDVFALGQGIVTRLDRTASGWPGTGALLVYHITQGPHSGKNVYVAEDFNPSSALKVGSPVSPGQVLGQATGSGLAPGIEVGFADATGRAFGQAFTSGGLRAGPQPMGHVFNDAVQKLSSGGGGSLLGGITGVITKLGETGLTIGTTGESAALGVPTGYTGAILGGANSAARLVPGVATAEDFLKAPLDAIKWLFNQQNLIRVGYVIGGSALVALGLLSLARSLGAVNVEQFAPPTVKLPNKISAPAQAERKRAASRPGQGEGTTPDRRKALASRRAEAEEAGVSMDEIPF